MFRRNIRFVGYEYLMILSAVGEEGFLFFFRSFKVRRFRVCGKD